LLRLLLLAVAAVVVDGVRGGDSWVCRQGAMPVVPVVVAGGRPCAGVAGVTENRGEQRCLVAGLKERIRRCLSGLCAVI